MKIQNLLLALMLITAISSCATSKSKSVTAGDFNEGWLFIKDTVENGQSISLDDSDWRKLNLPHDWAIEGPFKKGENLRVGALPVYGEAWYRKHFTIDKNHSSKQISIEFDGAMYNSRVWINGHYVGERPYGYIGFDFDLTPHIKFGEDNVIAVQLSPERIAARWYPGAGIYRNVYLQINDAVHIPRWGTFITTPEVSDEKATVNIETNIKNAGLSAKDVVLETILKDGDGTIVSSTSSAIAMKASTIDKVIQAVEVTNPQRWDITSPFLYTAESYVKIDDKVVDRFDSEFGIRTIEFDANKGFILNGNQVKFKGVCLHHDQGALGTGVNYRAKERQIQLMKEMGANALRTSHNPPSPELMQICDRLGFVVMIETFDEWKITKIKNAYNKYFEEWHERDLRDAVRANRNHPSVVMWCIGSEILEQTVDEGWIITKELNAICHEEDNTRPTTAAFNYFPAPFENKMAYNVDIVGLNYWPLEYAQVKEENPDMIIYGSETSSQTSSRGVYHLPIEAKEQHHTNHVSSYDVIVGPPWAYLPDAEFDAQEQNPFSLGEFIWTGIDYIGEPTPYAGRDNVSPGAWTLDWPSRSSYFGAMDLCGFPKDRFYLYQSQWTDEPMVHVLPHWNWEGKEGDTIPVFSYTNCEEVELFVNGVSFGKKVKGVDLTEIPAEFHSFKKGMYKSKYRLSWNVPYHPGSIKVIAYNDRKAVVEKEIKTAGTPSKIKLSGDRTTISADGKDLSFITVRIEDAAGNLCPLADNRVEFRVSDKGVIAAVDNGDQTSTDSFQANYRNAFNGLCLLVVKSTKNAGEISIEASSSGLTADNLIVKTK